MRSTFAPTCLVKKTPTWGRSHRRCAHGRGLNPGTTRLHNTALRFGPAARGNKYLQIPTEKSVVNFTLMAANNPEGNEPVDAELPTEAAAGSNMASSSSGMSALGELAQLSEQFVQHRARLLAMVERRLGAVLRQRVDPEDVLSEVYLRAQRRWSQFQRAAGRSPYAWLYRQTLDVLIELWRRHSSGNRNVQLDVPWPVESSIQMGFGLLDTGTSPSEALDRRDLQFRMQSAVERLREKDRQVLWMRHRDGLTFREIGEVLEITETNASVRYVRALGRLRVLWGATNESDGESAT